MTTKTIQFTTEEFEILMPLLKEVKTEVKVSHYVYTVTFYELSDQELFEIGKNIGISLQGKGVTECSMPNLKKISIVCSRKILKGYYIAFIVILTIMMICSFDFLTHNLNSVFPKTENTVTIINSNVYQKDSITHSVSGDSR